MSFYLLSEGLIFLGIFSGAYESLKVLSRAEKGNETSTLSGILEFWVVLAVTTVFEQYVELFVSWFPFYYLFKCMFLGLLLLPNTKFVHVLFDGFIEPGVAMLKLEFDTNVQPLLEALVLKHGHWFHQQLLARSLQLFCDQELLELERELQDKLTEVRSFLWIFYYALAPHRFAIRRCLGTLEDSLANTNKRAPHSRVQRRVEQTALASALALLTAATPRLFLLLAASGIWHRRRDWDHHYFFKLVVSTRAGRFLVRRAVRRHERIVDRLIVLRREPRRAAAHEEHDHRGEARGTACDEPKEPAGHAQVEDAHDQQVAAEPAVRVQKAKVLAQKLVRVPEAAFEEQQQQRKEHHVERHERCRHVEEEQRREAPSTREHLDHGGDHIESAYRADKVRHILALDLEVAGRHGLSCC